jgi:hypothetical protein
MPVDQTCTHETNPWRGALVSPYGANIQWDVYANEPGDYLVKMLYNEQESAFKTACQSIRPGSHFYRFDELRRCYGYR